MTTESKQLAPTRGTGDLLRAGAAAAVMVLAVALVGVLLEGGAAGAGALVGGLVATAVFLSGSLVVNTVAGIMPGLSLLFALSTYVVQLLALGLLFIVLDGGTLLDATLDRRWLGCTIIAVTATWLVVQVVLSTRARIPVYDLPPRVVER